MNFDPIEKIRDRVVYWLEESRKKNVKQSQVAANSGIDAGNLSAIKKGSRHLTIAQLRSLAYALEIYPSDLLPPSWIRPQGKADTARIEKAFQVVIESYIETAKEYGGDFISPEDMAKVAAVLIEDAEVDFNAGILKNNFKVLHRINGGAKN